MGKYEFDNASNTFRDDSGTAVPRKEAFSNALKGWEYLEDGDLLSYTLCLGAYLRVGDKTFQIVGINANIVGWFELKEVGAWERLKAWVHRWMSRGR